MTTSGSLEDELVALSQTAPRVSELIRTLDELRTALKGDMADLTPAAAYKQLFESARATNLGANAMRTDFDNYRHASNATLPHRAMYSLPMRLPIFRVN